MEARAENKQHDSRAPSVLHPSTRATHELTQASRNDEKPHLDDLRLRHAHVTVGPVERAGVVLFPLRHVEHPLNEAKDHHHVGGGAQPKRGAHRHAADHLGEATKRATSGHVKHHDQDGTESFFSEMGL